MNKNLPILLFFALLILCSCKDSEDKILGYWEATFSDSIHNPTQYLRISKANGTLQLVSDEPLEDWYGIPGEKLFFSGDSLYFERFWGLETYDGKFLPGDSVIQGTKHISNKKPVQFTVRRVAKEKLSYLIPRIDPAGNKIKEYSYSRPPQRNDALICGDIAEAGMDTLLIFQLINKILVQEIPNIHSLLIIKDNQLILEEYFYDYSIDKPHRIHSVSKSFTSALTGIAIDRGFISGINEPVWKYFKDWETAKWINDQYDIEIQHLLSMSAGLDWNALTLNQSNDDIDMYKTDDHFGFLLNKNLQYKPGTFFCYNNGLSLMLGHIIEAAAGLSVEGFSREYLFKDLGIANYAWDIGEKGITRTDGGLKMRPRDMLKFGFLYLNKGNWKDKQVVSSDWINTSTESKMQAGEQEYGFHWWIRKYEINQDIFESYYALGHGEQAIIIVPGLNLAVVMTAGNYLQPEHRPFEIMAEYILPSLSSK